MSARSLAVRILVRVLKHEEPLWRALSYGGIASGYGALSSRDRGFCYNLVLLGLRHYDMVWGFLGLLFDRGVKFKRHDRIGVILLLGVVQLLFLRVPLYSVLSESRILLRRRSELALKGFVHGVLSSAASRRDEFGGVVLGSVWAAGWRDFYGEERGDSIWSAIYDVPPLDLHFKSELLCDKFRCAFTESDLGEIVLHKGCYLRVRSDVVVSSLPYYADGDWWVQDLGASLAVDILSPGRDELVLDLCASPGGKTAHLLSLGCRVIAVDRSVMRLGENLSRLGLECEVICGDVLEYFSEHRFSAIILDLPCSGSGTVRHHPELPLIKRPEIALSLSDIQLDLLLHAYDNLLADGGRLVYSVCSLQEVEGEGVLSRFSGLRSGAVIESLSATSYPPSHVFGGRYLRTLPCDWSDRGRLDGFFFALVRKIDS